MKNEDTRKSLEAQILDCKKRLKELAPHIEEDNEKSKEYNKIIVQKAILVDRYKKLCFKPSLVQRTKEFFKGLKRKDKLVCDYFLS